MKWLPNIRFKLRVPFGKSKFEAEMVEEMKIHLELRTERNITYGMSPEEASYAAERGFGGLDQLKERARDQRGDAWLKRLTQDFRYGFRILRKSPVFTMIAVLSLALGIGAGTAIFSLVNSILLSSLPVPNPRELREISWYADGSFPLGISGIMGENGDGPGGHTRYDAFSLPAFLTLRKQCEAQADIFGYIHFGGVTARARGEAVSADGVLISGNFFSGLGVRPLIGRLIGMENEAIGAAPVVVISYRWWEEQFALDPRALGQQVVINQHSFTVIGVLPREFRGVRPGDVADIYAPISTQQQLEPTLPFSVTDPRFWSIALMARLRPGVRSAQLQAVLDNALKGVTATLPKSPNNEFKTFLADGSGGSDWNRSDYQKKFLLLLSMVGVVLLVTCANLAGLLLARGTARQHEFSIRIALGAGRRRLMRQLLTESTLLASLGGCFGVLMAVWGRLAISRLLAGSTSGLHYDTHLDLRVLSFALVVSLAVSLLSGILPAVKAGKTDPLVGLKVRANVGTTLNLRTGRLLVIAQIALSLLLVVGAGLYGRTLINLARINPGFSTKHLLLFQLDPGDVGYKDPHKIAYYEKIQHSLAAIPGVHSVTLSQYPPLADWNIDWAFKLPDHSEKRETGLMGITVGETFFATMGIPILLGRELKTSDSSTAPKVVVVNQAFVRKYMPNQIPIGQRISAGFAHDAIWQIVGVCRDVKFERVREEAPPMAYFSFRQNPTVTAYFILRTELPPAAIAAAVRKAVAAIDRNIPLTDLATQEQVRDQTLSSERTFAALCTSLGVLALLLSCIGLYGLMTYDVARRTAEIGIRHALGATRWQIAKPILHQAMLLATAGVAIGIPLTLALTRLVRAKLYGLKPSDPGTLCGAALLLLAVALIAAWIPARYAAKVDPLTALRTE